MEIAIRVICLVGGYGVGLIQTAYIYGRLKGVDIRKYGSGNAGTTNALRVLGKKAGLIVFLGDFLKGIVACSLTHVILGQLGIGNAYMFVLYTGLGVVLGHNFPFYMQFKGGKGIAASGGMIVGLWDWRLVVILLAAFIISVVITRYVFAVPARRFGGAPRAPHGIGAHRGGGRFFGSRGEGGDGCRVHRRRARGADPAL